MGGRREGGGRFMVTTTLNIQLLLQLSPSSVARFRFLDSSRFPMLWNLKREAVGGREVGGGRGEEGVTHSC